MKTKILLSAAIILLLAGFTLNANAQCRQAGFGTTGGINCLYRDSLHGNLYVGGGFHHSGTDSLNYCGYWNDSHYLPLGTTGLNGTNDSVWCFTNFNGNLYIGGSFSQAGGVACNHIARWDGTSWFPVGNGFNHSVHSLIVFKNEIYAGGEFTSSGSTPINYFAKWDGTQWVQVGGGTNNHVEAMCIWNGELYLGGDFTTAGGLTVNRICKWDGTNFSAVGSGFTGGMMGRCFVRSLCVYNGNLFAGGSFQHTGGMDMHNLGMWNGSSWSSIGEISGGMMGANVVNALCTYNGQLFIGGNFGSCGSRTANNLCSWNGSSWSNIGGGINGMVNSLAVFNGALYIAGAFSDATGTSVSNIAKYSIASGIQAVELDRSKLTIYPNPASDFVRVQWVSEQSSATTFLITDITGKTVFERTDSIEEGINQLDIPVRNLSNGLYFLTLSVGGSKQSMKFEVSK
jgi:hypothetical protein